MTLTVSQLQESTNQNFDLIFKKQIKTEKISKVICIFEKPKNTKLLRWHKETIKYNGIKTIGVKFVQILRNL